SFDERAPGGAARQRLDPEGAGAGEQIDDDRAVELDLVRQRVEHGLADLVGGGPRGQPLGRQEPPPAQLAGDHPHRRHTRSVLEPDPTIVCVDWGGRCHLLTKPPEDGWWEPGEIVAYRCEDCRDRWDLVLPEDPE